VSEKPAWLQRCRVEKKAKEGSIDLPQASGKSIGKLAFVLE
jgi:hypothetical protein